MQFDVKEFYRLNLLFCLNFFELTVFFVEEGKNEQLTVLYKILNSENDSLNRIVRWVKMRVGSSKFQ